jgi:hypothetical protein
MKSIIYIYNDVMLDWRLLLKAPKLELDLTKKCFKDDLQKIIDHVDWTKENVFYNLDFSKVKFLPDTDFSKSSFNNCIMDCNSTIEQKYIEPNTENKSNTKNKSYYRKILDGEISFDQLIEYDKFLYAEDFYWR